MTRYPPGFEQLQRAQIDFFVAPVRGRNAVAILGECRRVKNHHAESAANLLIFLQNVERVAFAEVTFAMSLSA